MNVSDIIAALDSPDDALPREALEQAMARPQDVTEPLLDLVRETVSDPAKVLDPENNSMGYVIALFLLAQFREQRACSLVIEALSLPGVDMDALFGDLLIDDMARILASVSGSDTLEICSLIENQEIRSESSRDGAQRPLLPRLQRGDRTPRGGRVSRRAVPPQARAPTFGGLDRSRPHGVEHRAGGALRRGPARPTRKACWWAGASIS